MTHIFLILLLVLITPFSVYIIFRVSSKAIFKSFFEEKYKGELNDKKEKKF